MRFSTILTSEQAAMLYDLVKEHRVAIVERTSFGILDGLLIALAQIDRGGGAVLCDRPVEFDWGRDVVEVAVLPRSSYITCPGARPVPRPYWNLAIAPYKDRQPVIMYEATDPLVVVPLVAAVVPPLLPLR
jgi:hypothetical protein